MPRLSVATFVLKEGGGGFCGCFEMLLESGHRDVLEKPEIYSPLPSSILSTRRF